MPKTNTYREQHDGAIIGIWHEHRNQFDQPVSAFDFGPNFSMPFAVQEACQTEGVTYVDEEGTVFDGDVMWSIIEAAEWTFCEVGDWKDEDITLAIDYAPETEFARYEPHKDTFA